MAGDEPSDRPREQLSIQSGDGPQDRGEGGEDGCHDRGGPRREGNPQLTVARAAEEVEGEMLPDLGDVCIEQVNCGGLLKY